MLNDAGNTNALRGYTIERGKLSEGRNMCDASNDIDAPRSMPDADTIDKIIDKIRQPLNHQPPHGFSGAIERL